MFIVFLVAVTGGLVATAAYFSVVGIASIFAYNYIPALILGTTLEAGKISVAVYLYRYWELLPKIFRAILLVFMVVLMIITSVGIFGFLSQGYQKTSEEQRILSLKLDNLTQEFDEKKLREQEINRQIRQLPNSSVMGRIRLSREFGDELEQIRDRVTVIEPEIQQLKVKRLEYESHIGPISYVAKMLRAPQDDVVFYAILLLVFVADPLAVTLVVATNMLLLRFLDPKFNPRLEPAPPGRKPQGNIMDQIVTRIRQYALEAHAGAKKRLSRRTTKTRANGKKAVTRRTASRTTARTRRKTPQRGRRAA